MVLNKGLGFVPNCFKPSYNTIDKDVCRFERRLQIYKFFKAHGDTDSLEDRPNSYPLLEKNPDWWPRILDPNITSFCRELKTDILKRLNFKFVQNLSNKEILALRQLKSNRDIIIKKCDKGGGIAIMDTLAYKNKINEMLGDTKVYTQTNNDDTMQVKMCTDNLIRNLHDRGYLNKKKTRYLTKFQPRCPIFYGAPKVHKFGCPLRPIVSQINGPTCRLNEYVDKLLTVAEKHIPYLLQDTTAYLNIINCNKNCHASTYLLTMDVVSLYTNIPHEEGAEWVSDFYDETLKYWDYSSDLIPVNKQTIKQLILFILKNCTFEFNGNFYRQNFGTTMGAKFSVKFANIYMHKWFQYHLPRFQGSKPTFIARLVDDCFSIWNSSEEEFLYLLDYLNTCHTSIKFEYVLSKTSVPFLDTITYIENCLIKTKLYTKPTDKKQYLHYKSGHPFYVKKAVPFSQAIRYKRVIEDETILKYELDKLKDTFEVRGYPTAILDTCISKVHAIDRSELLVYKSEVQKRQAFDNFLKGHSFLPFIITYHDTLHSKDFKKFFHSRWSRFANNNAMFKNELPQIVYKKNISIGNILCQTRFREPFDTIDIENINLLAGLLAENEQLESQISRCNNSRCKCCSSLICSNTYTDSSRTHSFTISDKFSCYSKHLIYLIICRKCNKQYVGQTSRSLRDRLNNHRSDITLKKNTAIAIHYNESSHSFEDLGILPIFSLVGLSEVNRNKMEFKFMRELNTFYPGGLNFYPMVK